jgi:hypothetical protein
MFTNQGIGGNAARMPPIDGIVTRSRPLHEVCSIYRARRDFVRLVKITPQRGVILLQYTLRTSVLNWVACIWANKVGQPIARQLVQKAVNTCTVTYPSRPNWIQLNYSSYFCVNNLRRYDQVADTVSCRTGPAVVSYWTDSASLPLLARTIPAE